MDGNVLAGRKASIRVGKASCGDGENLPLRKAQMISNNNPNNSSEHLTKACLTNFDPDDRTFTFCGDFKWAPLPPSLVVTIL